MNSLEIESVVICAAAAFVMGGVIVAGIIHRLDERDEQAERDELDQ